MFFTALICVFGASAMRKLSASMEQTSDMERSVTNRQVCVVFISPVLKSTPNANTRC
jgi:hypothetical protein